MPICENCKTGWTWKQTLKSSFVLTTSMKCPYCSKKQYTTPKSRKQILLLNMLIPLPLLIQAFFDIEGWVTINLMLGFFLLAIVLLPFWMKVQNEEVFLN
ncbi:TIGR04104 family putative zinc finger protein [Planococcus sp. 107-1]|uniref:TIGR04104 family putative zinc finger protein n=1 Tax=Planococcus sp. 107-1 TaxID=2908840 RepID=UPI0037CB3F94